VDYPEIVFNHISIFNTKPMPALINIKVIPEIGVNPHLRIDTPPNKDIREKFFYTLKNNINIFLTTRSMYEYREIVKQFSCLAQS